MTSQCDWEFWLGPDGRCVYMSPACERITGHTADEFMADPGLLGHIIHPDDRERFEYHRREIRQEAAGHIAFRIVRPDGGLRWIDHVCYPMFEEGRYRAQRGCNRDITGQQPPHIQEAALEALQASEARFRALVDSMDDIVYTLDCEQRHTGLFGRWLEKHGLRPEQFMGKTVRQALGDEAAPVHEAANARALAGENAVYEWALPGANGLQYFQTSVSPLRDARGEIVGIVGVGRDITALKAMENQLRDLLQERETLIRETYHRVKNNFTLVGSLLGLQAAQTGDPRTRAMFKESQARLAAMSLVHEQLYRLGQLERVDAADYLRELATKLFRAYKTTSTPVKLVCEVDRLSLDFDVAMHCGLIVNELVTNALKYAFPSPPDLWPPLPEGEGRNGGGEIHVELRAEARQYMLIVSDNGVGLPADLDWRNTPSLGLRLVNMLATHDLGGTIELDRHEGTRWIIRFGEC